MTDQTSADSTSERDALVPISVGDQMVYLAVRRLDDSLDESDEREIGARPSLDQVLGGLSGLAQEMGKRLRKAEVSKVSVEFGCEFAIESGGFVAVIGKASAKSVFKVGLEWSKPTTS